MSVAVPAIEFRSVQKKFGDFYANRDITFSVTKGSIHGIVGENGAGKSTAMKMLYGLQKPTAGEIRLHGEKRQWRSPSEAIAAGIGMVHQHFMLAGPYTVLDNILLGCEPVKNGWDWLPEGLRPIDRDQARRDLTALAQDLSLDISWDAPIESLPVGTQQRIEILKLLYRKADVLILDEPTAVLTPQERDDLFAYLRKLKAQGRTILIITHKLKEVMALTDEVTVFRAGEVTGRVKTQETNEQQLADFMVGRRVQLTIEKVAPANPGEAVLELDHVTLDGVHQLWDVTMSVRSGEIVGLAGVEGNGQNDLLQLVLNPKRTWESNHSSGKVWILGSSAKKLRTRDVCDLGVGVIPQDRHQEALLLKRTNFENFLLGRENSADFQSRGIIRRQNVSQALKEAIQEYDVRPPQEDFVSGRMSGGNQQKLIIAREMGKKPKFLVAAQPTRGVDVGAIEFIHRKILDARDHGVGVLLVSSELEEVMALSDRILVFFEGKIVAEFARGEADEKTIGLYMGGAHSTKEPSLQSKRSPSKEPAHAP